MLLNDEGCRACEPTVKSLGGESAARLDRAGRRRFAVLLAWGVLVAVWRCWPFFVISSDQFFDTHEGTSYVLRQIEFDDCLAAGYWSPQWCSHFRAGLGSPYFGYYQPGLFYLAGVMPHSMAPVRRLGCVLAFATLAGYLGVAGLVRGRFGWMASAFAGTLFVTTSYATMNLYVRGDLSEYAAMMLVPVVLRGVDRCLNSGSRGGFVGLAVAGGALIAMHPAVALVTYGLSTAALGTELLFTRQWRRAVGGLAALACGSGLAAFYWLPVFSEWHYVNGDAAFSGYYEFGRHFVDPCELVGLRDSDELIAVRIEPVVLAIVLLSTGTFVGQWRRATQSQRRLFVFSISSLAACVFLMSHASQWFWEHVPLLRRLQFPWRLLSLTTLALAAAGGCALPARAAARPVLFAALMPVLVANALAAAKITVIPGAFPSNAVKIADQFFAPDLMDEWLPRGARVVTFGDEERRVVPSPGATVARFRSRQGWLSFDVATEQPATATVPQYYFPAGWAGVLQGRRLALSADPNGLLVVSLPEKCTGTVQLTFRATPMRRIGILISCVTATILTASAAARRVRRRTGGVFV